MKNVKLAVWIFLIWILQTVFTVFLEIGGTLPELLYVFLLCYTFCEKKPENYITVGIICGILAETVSGGGFSLISYVVSVFLLVFVLKIIYKDIPLLIIPIVFVFTVFKESIYYILNAEAFESVGYINGLKNIIVPMGIYNGIAGVVIKKLLTLTVFSKKKRRR